MSSVWFADISMESLPGPRPVRPTVSLRPSMACFRQQSARLVDMHALKPCARSCFSLPENLTSPRSTRMPAEPHYPLSFQKSPLFRPFFEESFYGWPNNESTEQEGGLLSQG